MMKHPGIAAMTQTDVGIRNTHITGTRFPTILYDDFTVCAPAVSTAGPGIR